jgi:NAD(P)-dependent dehydrogenase (short-subunit alcohol dehydrogenase family)
MSNPSSRVAIVTGAGSGIGAAIGVALIGRDYRVYGTSRGVDKAQPSSGIAMRALDLRDDAAMEALVDEVVRTEGRIDVLVNNAGLNLVGALEETSLAEAKELFDVDFFGALRATTAVLPFMRVARYGRILFTSSAFGFLPAPFMGIYAAAKHAIEGYAESLDHEVRGFGVRSILIEPGYTATQITRNQRETTLRLPEYATARDRVLAALAENIRRGGRSEDVAEAVLEAVSASPPKLRYAVGGARSLHLLRQFVPAAMFEGRFRRRIGLDA